MTLLKQWALNQVRPPLSGRAPLRVCSDPDWASTLQAQRSTFLSWALLSQAPCVVAPPCSARGRDHTLWTSLKCVPVWSLLLHVKACRLSWLHLGCLGLYASYRSGMQGVLMLGVTSSFSLLHLRSSYVEQEGEMKSLKQCLCGVHLRWSRKKEGNSRFIFNFFCLTRPRVRVEKTDPGTRTCEIFTGHSLQSYWSQQSSGSLSLPP